MLVDPPVVPRHPRARFAILDMNPMLAGGAAAVEAIGIRIGQISRAVFIGGVGGGFWRDAAANHGVTLAFTAIAGIAVAAAVFYTTSGRLKSPWHRRKRKNILSAQQWRCLFTPDGKLHDNGIKFLKKVRTGGIDPSIRAEVWPFLLGVFELTSSKQERDVIIIQKRKEYEKLRKQCRRFVKDNSEYTKLNERAEKSVGDSAGAGAGAGHTTEGMDSPVSSVESSHCNEDIDQPTNSTVEQITENVTSDSDTSNSDESDDPETSQTFNLTESTEDNDHDLSSKEDSLPSKMEVQSLPCQREDFATWQRIIRLDAVRANGEWMEYNPEQAAVSDAKARHAAEVVSLTGYEHLEPSRIFHASRLVAILEAYALYDPEIGYCQGMSDLLSPIISVMREDHEAFWCFVGFMKKARHNFRLDEVGIRRQLNIVAKIIKYKDTHLYRHLEELQAEDCFFVYRMVVVLFRRELTFEQTLCLWEVMWADQAALRAGVGKSAWDRIRQQAPPTEDLLLYAIAASVLQRRKQIIEKYSSMDEILRECNSMAGHLDVWKLLDDAHSLVVTLHDKIETPL